jgi:predicted heme/steroid binding protein
VEGTSLKEFSSDELRRYNGKNGAPAYIAFDGKVYDVSDSFLWKDGKHEALHNAGIDLTEAMKHAPHSGNVLERFPVVGTLSSSNSQEES